MILRPQRNVILPRRQRGFITPFMFQQAARGGAANNDPHFASVVLLAVNDNAADATTTFVDQSSYGRTLTAAGNAQYDTAQAPTGMTSSLLVGGTGDRVTSADAAEFDVGTQDFTLELWARPAALVGVKEWFGRRTSGGFAPFIIAPNGTALQWYASSGGAAWDVASASAIGTVATGTWYAVALTREGSTFRAFLDGTKNATEVSSAASLYDPSQGINIAGVSGVEFNGHLACVRWTIGVARYTANYTPPTLPLPTS